MPYKQRTLLDNQDNTPDSDTKTIGELRKEVDQFVTRMRTIEQEEETLRQSKKDLVEEFKTKLDTQTLKLALRLVDIRSKAKHKHQLDVFLELLEEKGV